MSLRSGSVYCIKVFEKENMNKSKEFGLVFETWLWVKNLSFNVKNVMLVHEAVLLIAYKGYLRCKLRKTSHNS